MTKSATTIKAMVGLIFSLALFTTAHAQVRVFVSGLGSDANPCSRTAPCRTFQHAYNVVTPEGEVVALDSAGYGPVTITKSVTIAGDGAYTGITVFGGAGITIATPGINVNLRSLHLQGESGGTFGIHVTAVSVLHIEGCVISGFDGTGVFVDLTTSGRIYMKDTIVKNNGANGLFIIADDGQTARVSIDNCRFEQNFGCGVWARNNSRVTINRSVASGNFDDGFRVASQPGGGSSDLSCENCVSSDNTNGFAAGIPSGGLGFMRVSHSTATYNTDNGFVEQNVGSIFESLGNNFVRGNAGGNTSGTITIVPAQ